MDIYTHIFSFIAFPFAISLFTFMTR